MSFGESTTLDGFLGLSYCLVNTLFLQTPSFLVLGSQRQNSITIGDCIVAGRNDVMIQGRRALCLLEEKGLRVQLSGCLYRFGGLARSIRGPQSIFPGVVRSLLMAF